MHPKFQQVTEMARQFPAAARSFLQGAAQAARRHPWRAAAVLPALVLLYVLVLIPFTPGIGDIRKARTERPAVLLSADGKELAAFKRTNREWVVLGDVAPQVVTALIATEDHRFYEHHGIDVRRTLAAVLHTLRGDRQGGSTISQQLARNLYPDDIGRAPTLTRKIKEAITALKIEAVYSKDEILETYLNTVPFLYNAQGIEMAARTYFDKPASKLDVLESATLIGMLKGTRYYNPVLNPERALQRRNTVLGQMVKHHRLSEAQLVQLKKKPLKLDFERQDTLVGPAPHFSQHLRRWLIDWADRNGYNIYDDGLVVRTTIDARLQALANQAVARQASRLQAVASADWSPRTWSSSKTLVQALVREAPEYRAAREAGQSEEQALKQLLANATFMQELRQDKTRLQAGFVAIDPRNGQVRAWVGSRDFNLDPFDHVQQARRQPGSTFKPFVYGAAFAQGARPGDTFIDQAVEIPLGGKAVWRPTDGGEPSGRAMSLREGLTYSKNTITAQLMQQVGPARVAQMAQSMGVRQSTLEAVPSLALGTSPVTLLEMVSAYGTIANSGNFAAPQLVTRIEDRNGKVLEEFQPAPSEPAMEGAVADTLLDVMRGVVDQGTGAGVRTRFGVQADVAGKTGTTQNNTDGWFILMHPQLVAGAWMGFNDSRITMRGNYWGQGAHNALLVVGDFFQQGLRAKAIDADARFSAPHVVEAPPPAEPDAGYSDGYPPGAVQPAFPVPTDPPPPTPYPQAPPRGVSAEPAGRAAPPAGDGPSPAVPQAGRAPFVEVVVPVAGQPVRLQRAGNAVVVAPRQPAEPPAPTDGTLREPPGAN